VSDPAGLLKFSRSVPEPTTTTTPATDTAGDTGDTADTGSPTGTKN
jgi:hypothetical protein